jgi:hypothetical protein
VTITARPSCAAGDNQHSPIGETSQRRAAVDLVMKLWTTQRRGDRSKTAAQLRSRSESEQTRERERKLSLLRGERGDVN